MNQNNSNRRNRPPQKRRRHRPKNNRGNQAPSQSQNQNRNSEPQYPVITHTPKTYGVEFYKKIEDAKADLENLKSKAAKVDQLNIVIKADADMNDPDLCAIGKVFAGEAWTLIHERRLEDEWYSKPQ